MLVTDCLMLLWCRVVLLHDSAKIVGIDLFEDLALVELAAFLVLADPSEVLK